MHNNKNDIIYVLKTCRNVFSALKQVKKAIFLLFFPIIFLISFLNAFSCNAATKKKVQEKNLRMHLFSSTITIFCIKHVVGEPIS